jgi:hypothetical protein
VRTQLDLGSSAFRLSIQAYQQCTVEAVVDADRTFPQQAAPSGSASFSSTIYIEVATSAILCVKLLDYSLRTRSILISLCLPFTVMLTNANNALFSLTYLPEL